MAHNTSKIDSVLSRIFILISPLAASNYLSHFIHPFMKSLLLLAFLLLGSQLLSVAQTVSVEIDGDDLYYSESGCSDCWAGPDVRWRSRITLNSTNYAWNVDRDDITGCGWRGITNYSWVNPVAADASDGFTLSFDGYEEDDFPCLFYGSDDAICGGYANLRTISNICDYNPYQWNYFTDTRTCNGGDGSGEYRVYWSYYWSYTQAPAITQQPNAAVLGGSTRDVCAGTPITLQTTFATNNCGGVWARHIQWQSAPSSGGPWSDVSGATSASYAPPQTVGTIHYRCRSTSNEGAVFTSLTTASNTVAVTYYSNLDNFCAAPNCNFIYIATFGIDAPGNGGPNNPFRTLGYVLNNYATVGGGRTHIRMEGKSTPLSSDYVESAIITMRANMFVEGGFEVSGALPRSWKKNSTFHTLLTCSGSEVISSSVAHVLGVKADGVNGWTLQDLRISTTNTSAQTSLGHGHSNMGVYINTCTGYNITRCAITAGTAAAGGTGAVGNIGSNGVQGNTGGNGTCDSYWGCGAAGGGGGGAGREGGGGAATGPSGGGVAIGTNAGGGSGGSGGNGGSGGLGQCSSSGRGAGNSGSVGANGSSGGSPSSANGATSGGSLGSGGSCLLYTSDAADE